MVDQTQLILFGDQALKLATLLNNNEEIAVALRNIGSAYMFKGEYHSALAHYYKAL
jgi:hypothetical protein